MAPEIQELPGDDEHPIADTLTLIVSNEATQLEWSIRRRTHAL